MMPESCHILKNGRFAKDEVSTRNSVTDRSRTSKLEDPRSEGLILSCGKAKEPPTEATSDPLSIEWDQVKELLA